MKHVYSNQLLVRNTFISLTKSRGKLSKSWMQPWTDPDHASAISSPALETKSRIPWLIILTRLFEVHLALTSYYHYIHTFELPYLILFLKAYALTINSFWCFFPCSLLTRPPALWIYQLVTYSRYSNFRALQHFIYTQLGQVKQSHHNSSLYDLCTCFKRWSFFRKSRL